MDYTRLNELSVTLFRQAEFRNGIIELFGVFFELDAIARSPQHVTEARIPEK